MMNNSVNLTMTKWYATRSTYDFEIEGREILIPEKFRLIHDIQSEWTVVVIHDAFNQLLDIYKSMANRDKDNLEPVNEIINFLEPPRIEEFCKELDRIQTN